MITTDKALDLVPYMVDIYEKMDKGLLDKSVRKGDTAEVGKKAMVSILKNLNKFKPEIYGMVSVVTETTPEEVSNQNILKTLKVFKEIYNEMFKDPEMADFFGSAVRQDTQDA